LATGGKTIGHKTLEEDRAEVGSGQVDGGGMSCGAGADDDLGRKGIGTQVGRWTEWGGLTTLECIFVLLSFFPVTGAIW
jgi:hypothetical protein